MSTVTTPLVTGRAHSEWPPCCLRVDKNKDIIVGTYELDKKSGERYGRLEVYDQDLNPLGRTDICSAILDLRLFENSLVTAHADGSVSLWENHTTPVHKLRLKVFEDALVTSLCIAPNTSSILATSTTGNAALIDVQTLSNVRQFSAQHSLECWTGAFGTLSPLENVIFTGGDDAGIIVHDIRTKDPIWQNTKIHDAGLVAIMPSSKSFRRSKPTSLITGSYDDCIRSLELRMLGDSLYPGHNTPVLDCKKLNLNGGVWRFSEIPPTYKTRGEPDTLMVCCMYNGAQIVQILDDADQMFNVTHHLLEGHESMCYGGDWTDDLIATCSFYDRSIQTWNI